VPGELAMRFMLHVYKFQPDKPHGDPSCGAGEGRRRDEGTAEPEADEAAAPLADP